MASARKEFVIEPRIIEGVLDFWRTVSNEVMSHIELDKEELTALPDNEVS